MKSVFNSVSEGLRTVIELLGFFGRRGRWWLFPMVVVLVLFGMMLLLATATPLGAFIYTLF
jgi:hypothetical protein